MCAAIYVCVVLWVCGALMHAVHIYTLNEYTVYVCMK